MFLKKLFAGVLALGVVMAAVPAQAAEVSPSSGYDVSYPQCYRDLPETFAFAAVGVNGGRVWDTNNCLEKLLRWAGKDVQLYINTGNPMPYQSAHWPYGKKAAGVTCLASKPNSADCSFVYGFLGAKDSYGKAKAGFDAAGFSGSPADNIWWLDVELTNSWRQYTGTDEVTGAPVEKVSAKNKVKNLANLRGAVYYLENVAHVKQLGFYSTVKQWRIITGGTSMEFSDHPVWYANGRGLEAAAIDACDGKKYDGEPDEVSTAFTGSAAIISQYVDSDLALDVNVPCTGYALTETSFSSTNYTPKLGTYFYIRATLKTAYETPVAGRLVTLQYRGATYELRTNAKGVASKRVKIGVRGSYDFSFSYAGDVVLTASNVAGVVTVN